MDIPRRKFGDLSKHEKALVVGGIAEALVILVGYVVFDQFFVIEDRLHMVSLMNTGSLFEGARLIVASLFLIIGIPSLVTFVIVSCYFAGRSAYCMLVGVGFVITFACLTPLWSIALLTLFDMLLPDASITVQAVLMSLAILSGLPLTVQMLRLNRVQSYGKRLFW